jgi:adenylate cyclase
LWAERYDRQLEDMFRLQDEIAEQVAGAIEPELLKKEGQRVAARPTEDVTAWDLVRRGMWYFHKFTRENHWKAYDYFKRAIEAAPEAAEGYIWVGRVCGGIYAYGWADDPGSVLREGLAVSSRAVQIDDKNPYAHYAMAVTNCFAGNLEPAHRAALRVLAISPSFALGHCFLGVVHLMSGRPKEAVGSFEHGLRLSPSDPQNFTFYGSQALAYYFTGEPEKGLQAAHRALEMRPHLLAALAAIVLCSRALGDEKEASEALEAIKVNRDRATQATAGSDIITFVIKFNPTWAEPLRQVLGTDEVIE